MNVDLKAIIQTVLSAGIIGLIVMYGNQKIISTDLKSLEQSMDMKVKSIRRDIDHMNNSVREMRRDLYMPASIYNKNIK